MCPSMKQTVVVERGGSKVNRDAANWEDLCCLGDVICCESCALAEEDWYGTGVH